jgi:hypothetical protein
MLSTRENIRIINFDSIIIVTIVFFGLLIYSNSFIDKTDLNRKPVSTYITVSENNAVSSPCLRLMVFQKTWILNRDNFNLLAFNNSPLSENKKTDLRISHFETLRRSSQNAPGFIPHYHLFPSEPDEFLFLS